MVINRKISLTIFAFIIAGALMSADSCDSSNETQSQYSDTQGKQAIDKWGNPNITNFNEYKMAKDLYELRDRTDLVLNAYLQGNDGSLRCLPYKVAGYGIPYATQVTPQNDASGRPVREPNALFMPDSAEATWILLIGPDGKRYPTYAEPRLVVSPLPLPCKSLDQ